MTVPRPGAPLRRPQRSDWEWRFADGSLADPEAGPAPRTPHPVITPPSYPTEVHPALRNEATFHKLSQETAFFAFYFQQARAGWGRLCRVGLALLGLAPVQGHRAAALVSRVCSHPDDALLRHMEKRQQPLLFHASLNRGWRPGGSD